jgi:hypothetical protein
MGDKEDLVKTKLVGEVFVLLVFTVTYNGILQCMV